MATTVFTMPLMLGITALALTIGLTTEHAELSALAALLLVIVGGARAWSERTLVQLRTTLRVSRQKLFPDEPISVAVDVENAKLLPVSLRVTVPLGAAMRGRKPVGRTSLFSYQRASFKWQLPALQRGVHTLGPIALEAADPLGFFPTQRSAAACEVIVYPRLVPLRPSALPRRDFFGQRSLQGPVEDPVLITGVRDYQHGRSARYIHWKASARLGRLMEKMCDAAEHESVLLVVRAEGFERDPTGQAVEHCLEVVASLAERLDQQRCAFGLVTNAALHGAAARVIPVARREGQLAQLLEALARVQPLVAANLNELVQHALSYGITAVCFTYELDEEMHAVAELFKKWRLPLVIVSCSGSAAGDSRVHTLEELRE